MDDIRRQAAELVAKARARGSRGTEVLFEQRRITQIGGARAGAHPASSLVRTVHVRVYAAGGRMGQAHGEVAQFDRSDGLLDQAWAQAATAPEDPHAGPPPRLDVRSGGLDILDRRLPHIDDDARIEAVDWHHDACDGSSVPVRLVHLSYREVDQQRVFASSRGFDLAEASTRFGVDARAVLGEHPDVEVHEVEQSRSFADASSMPVGAIMVERLMTHRNRAPMPPSRQPVVFEPRVVAALVRGIAPAFQRERVEAGSSFLARLPDGQLGAPLLHILDDAGRAGGLETRAFDDRGVPPVPLTLVKEGQVRDLYMGTASARAHDSRPTGHERADGSLWTGNLLVRSGNRSRNMLFPGLGKFVIVDALMDPDGIDIEAGTIDSRVRLFRGTPTGQDGYIGVRRLRCPLRDVFGALTNMTSDQRRFGDVDACTWLLDGPWFEEA